KEPLKGIDDDIWILKSGNLDNKRINSKDIAATGLVYLTLNASKSFLPYNQSIYINTLLNELSDKAPIRRSRLSSNNYTKLIHGHIVISIHIDVRNNENERTVSEVFSDLSNMIVYKNITTFSSSVTNDLDQYYGFIPI
ncbi:13296_t:CDS:2, partial [Dentiscutata heterogama]